MGILKKKEKYLQKWISLCKEIPQSQIAYLFEDEWKEVKTYLFPPPLPISIIDIIQLHLRSN